MKLSYKKVSYLVMFALLAGGGFYYYTINRAFRSGPVYGQGAAIGPDYFPNVLAVLLAVLCLFSIYRTWQMEDREIEVPYAGQILLAAGLTALFIGTWSLIGLFYPLAFLFVSALLYAYRAQPGRRTFFATTSLLIAFVLTGALYLVFDLFMSLRF